MNGSDIVAKDSDPSAHAHPLTGPRCGKIFKVSPVSQFHNRAVLHKGTIHYI